MTVAELVAELAKFPQNAEVAVVCDDASEYATSVYLFRDEAVVCKGWPNVPTPVVLLAYGQGSDTYETPSED